MKKLAVVDFNRTVYEPTTGKLVEGVLMALSTIKSAGFILYLVSRKEAGRKNILGELGVRHLFAKVEFVKEKSVPAFKKIIRGSKVRRNNIYFIGDYLYDEIRMGNQCGVKTVWFKHPKYADLKPQIPEDKAWKEITQLSELPSVLGCKKQAPKS